MSAPPARPRVLIAGCGVAGLETLLALRALAGDQLGITVVAPELKFFNQAMSVEEPFKPRRGRGIRLDKTFAEFGARWVHAELDCVKHEQRLAVSRDGERLSYDRLVLALGRLRNPRRGLRLLGRVSGAAREHGGGSNQPDMDISAPRRAEMAV